MTQIDTDPPRHWSVRNRLVSLLVMVMLGLWGIASFSIYQQAKQVSSELFDESLKETAHVLLAVIEHEIEEHGPNFVEQLIGESGYPSSHYLRFQVWSQDLRLVYRSIGAPTTPMLAMDGGANWVGADGQLMHTYSTWNTRHSLQIQVAEPLSYRDKIARGALNRLIVFTTIFLPCTALLIWLVIARSFAPIQWLGSAVSQRTANNLDPLDTRHVPREVAPLILSFNRLLVRVREAITLEREFTADAAHELRTPLAAIRAHAQVLSAARNPGEANEAARDIIAGVDRGGRLVDQLLALARLDASLEEMSVRADVELDLQQIVFSEIELQQDLAQRRQISLTADTQVARVRGSTEALQILLRNLIDNALRATPVGGAVQVACGENGSGAWLAVRDSGVGIQAEERERIFRRFYRVKGSAYGGSGLGLSIVQRVAERHGAAIKFTDGLHGRGVGVMLTFPSLPTF
ncbi:MAG: ATP-binding protein [Steroidobacteraceae bacterium]